MIHQYDGKAPNVRLSIFIADNCSIVGEVTLGRDTSVWYGAVIRGDVAPIEIGSGTNIQDLSVLHVDVGRPLSIGHGVTVGHGAILHACAVGNDVLVGMGSRILNGAQIGENSIIGAGALVPPGKRFPPRSMLLGVPARLVRNISDAEIAEIRTNAERYILNARRFAEEQ
ncbi:MAG: gamma carbonic anhydrase family protein [Spirochaetales bacterium]|nr:gamma carbonic anhydrase family protein [Spirochaetales bacterium]